MGRQAWEQLEGASSIYVPAEKMVLHQHVLNTLLQWLLLLLCIEQPQSLAGTTLQPHRSLLQPTLHHSPPGKSNARDQPSHILTSLLAGSSQSWERLKAKQHRTLGPKNSLWSRGALVPTCQLPLPPSSKPCRAAYSPELTLDLDPTRATQEGPGLVPLFDSGQAGAEYLQPQV